MVEEGPCNSGNLNPKIFFGFSGISTLFGISKMHGDHADQESLLTFNRKWRWNDPIAA
jgi:hypothetical protein